jgi:hypothetical protein
MSFEDEHGLGKGTVKLAKGRSMAYYNGEPEKDKRTTQNKKHEVAKKMSRKGKDIDLMRDRIKLEKKYPHLK